MLIINAPHWRGPALYALALLLFACLDATTKYLAQSYNVPLIVAIRYLVHFALMLLLLAPLEGRRLIETRHPGWVILRGASLATVSVCVGLALSRMPVAETTAIVFLAPIAVVMLAVPLLGETLGRLGWGACLTGFIGVLLIARPGSGLDQTGMMFAFGAVIAATLYQLLSRYLASRERTVTLLFFTAVFGSLAYGLLLPWTLHGPTPSLTQTLLFLSMGFTGGLGHYLYTAAYRHASASTLAPMNYLQLLWAGLLGWVIFGHLPDQISLLGMLLIAGSGVTVALSNRRPPQASGSSA